MRAFPIFEVGDRVMSRHSLGACAEIGNAKAALCDKVPEGMSIEQAGVFRGAYATAYYALLQRGRMVAGEWVLVHGAAGGIGIAAIQVAKLFGAKVIATASTEAKRAACVEEGADHAIDYRGGFVDKVKELTGGKGVDIVYDPIGDKVAEESLRCLAWGGRLLILGFLGGGPTNIKSNYLLIKGIDAVGVRIGGLNESESSAAIANMKKLTELAGQGKLRPRISHRFRARSDRRSAAGGDRSRSHRQGGSRQLAESDRRGACGSIDSASSAASTRCRFTRQNVPQPGLGQVTVRIRACSLNHRDLNIVSGGYTSWPIKPGAIPLSDGAGEVTAVGPEVTRWKIGDRVAPIFVQRWLGGELQHEYMPSALGGPSDGVLAEHIVLSQEGLVRIPAHMSFEQAATLPCAAVTAWNAALVQGQLEPGRTHRYARHRRRFTFRGAIGIDDRGARYRNDR